MVQIFLILFFSLGFLPVHPGLSKLGNAMGTGEKPAVLDSDTLLGRPGGSELSLVVVMQVDEPAKVLEKLVQTTESMQGYFTKKSQEFIEMRVPMKYAESWMDSLPNLGLIMERTLMTEALEGQWIEQSSRLKAKQATLTDYFAMLKVSGDSTIFLIQNAIIQIQREMEETTQTIIKLEDRMHYARFTVYFRFPDRTAPLTTGESHFHWLNRLDLKNLLNRFRYVEN